MRKHFRAPWSAKLKLTTGLFAVVLIAVAATTGGWGSAVALIILVAAAGFAVRGYSVVDGRLLIHRLGWSTKYDLTHLTGIRFEPGATMGSIRALGIGGLFGFVGHYHNEMLGTYKAYVTDESRTVVMEFDQGTIVVTPGDPAAFLEAVEAVQAGG